MEKKQALSCLAALAHETRLTLFRLLVKMGPDGLPAGDIAQRLNVPPPTLSFHLKELERAGLIIPTRQHRQILYAANYEAMRDWFDFMMRDCCQGDASICGELPAVTCCPPATLKETLDVG